MKRDRRSLAVGAAVLTALFLGAAAAPHLSSHDPATQYDPAAGRHLPPGSERYELILANGRRLLAEDLVEHSDGVVIWRLGRVRSISSKELASPEPAIERRRFILGTDRLGRDCLARILFGARISLTIGGVAAIAAGLIGFAIGSMAALRGGLIDAILMRLADSLLAFPPLFLLLLLLALFEAGWAATALFLSLVGWMPIARIVRTEIRSLSCAEFTLAARAVGQSTVTILRRQLAPHLLSSLCVATTLRLAEVMLLEAALSFLGLGVRPPTPTWGQMIAGGAPYMDTAWWVALFPGTVLFATVFALNLIGDALRNLLDPRVATPLLGCDSSRSETVSSRGLPAALVDSAADAHLRFRLRPTPRAHSPEPARAGDESLDASVMRLDRASADRLTARDPVTR